jgi:hypothetical protein
MSMCARAASLRWVAMVFFLALASHGNAARADEGAVAPGQGQVGDEKDSYDLELDGVEPVEVVAAESAGKVEPHVTMCRSLTIPSAYLAKRGTLQFTVDHRAFKPIRYRDHWYQNLFEDALGLDGGALKIGLSLRYAIADYLDISVTRQNGVAEIFDTYDTGVRIRLLRAERYLLDLAVGVGMSWFYQPQRADAVAWNGFLAARVPIPFGLELGGVVAGSTDSSGPQKSNVDGNASLALGGHLAYRPLDWLELRADTLAPVAGYDSGWPAVTGGISFLTWRHAFTMLVSNTQYVTLDAVTAGAHQGLSDVVFGFVILRQWD